MASLRRVAAVYKLLERVSLAEAVYAQAEVSEVDRGLAELHRLRGQMREEGRQGTDDAVSRTVAQVCLESAGTLTNRLTGLRGERREKQVLAMLRLGEDRVRLEQVEQVLRTEREAEEAEGAKRAQAEADERFLLRKYRRIRSMKTF